MNSCPVCGKPVDPIRAPAVGVRDGKVISYCSKEHAAEAETKPTVVPARPATDPAFRIPEGDQKKSKKARTPASGTPQAASLLDSGPVIEIVHEPASGVVTSAADARSGSARPSASSMTSGAIQIADTGRLDDYVSSDGSSGSKKWIIAVVILALGGGAVVAYQRGVFGGTTEQKAAPPAGAPKAVVAVVAVVAPDAPAAPVVTKDAAIGNAKAVLTTLLTSDSPRIQRLAASALSRTGDPAAISALDALRAKETSDIAKLDLLYALARAGDKRGTTELAPFLQSSRRDVKQEAARRFAWLGDKRGADTLANYLDVSQDRLGAAEILAFLAEPRAIKVLEAIRADDKALPDDKARAAIALGFANKADIAPALHELLKDSRFNSFAAAALANLHDEAARPVLVKQLDVSALRVSAARSLRRLDENLDPVPLLPALLAALTSAKDTEQVATAEEILLLAGPADWSAHE